MLKKIGKMVRRATKAVLRSENALIAWIAFEYCVIGYGIGKLVWCR